MTMLNPTPSFPAPKDDERSEADVGGGNEGAALPSPHVKPKRRTFTAQYKLDVLRQADQASEPGHIALLLRREGLYSSHLTQWRRWREQLEAGKPPQPKASSPSALRQEVQRLQRENLALSNKLHQTQMLVELQKKLNQTIDAFDVSPNEGSTP